MLRMWATGVAIVTTSHNGQQHGMTVSSFTSISLDPPRLLISLDKETRTHRLISRSKLFCVTLLAEDQEDISVRFAGGLDDVQDRFEGIELSSSPNGSPILDGGLAWFDCRVVNSLDAGSHTVYVAELLATGTPIAGDSIRTPLIYYDREYRKIR